MVAAVDRKRRRQPADDPRIQPGACVKTPGNYRAYVLGPDPKNSGRILIEYEQKGLGQDSYNLSMLTLVHPAPETGEEAPNERTARQNPGDYPEPTQPDHDRNCNPSRRRSRTRQKALVQVDGAEEGQTHRHPADLSLEASGLNVSALSTQHSTIIDAELLPSRTEQLTQLEAQISAGIDLCKQGEQQIWVAAHTIRSEKLWQDAGFKSFEEYCEDRWQWAKSNAHEVAGAGEVILQLKEAGTPDLPTSIAAIRPLRKLQPEQRLQAIQEAKAESGKLTAEAVKQAIAKLAAPKPIPMANPLPPATPEERKWHLGDWVEGTDDDGKLVQGTVAAVGIGYLRLTDNTAVYNPTLLQPFDYSAAAPADEPLSDSSELVNDSDELTKEQKSLLHTLKQLAQQKSDEIYNTLCKLNTDTNLETLAEIAAEIEEAIAEILESHLLGG